MVEQRKKDLLKLSKSGRNNLEIAVDKLLNFDFNELDIKKLSWTNLYRCRIWKYRIIFDRDNSEIKILKIWNRGDIYKS